MTAPVGVQMFEEIRPVAEAVLASLPLSYQRAQGTQAAVVVVGGSSGWPTAVRQALGEGAAAVIVVEPQPAQTAELLAAKGPALVALDRRWAANPVVGPAAHALAAALPMGGRLEVRTLLPVGSPLESALVDQLGLIRALVGEATGVRLLARSVHGFAAEGVAADHPVDLSVVCTDAAPPNATVRLLTADGSVELRIPSGATALPAELSVTSPEGLWTAPTLFESAHRATWRRVRELIVGHQVTTDVEQFDVDQRSATDAFQQVEG